MVEELAMGVRRDEIEHFSRVQEGGGQQPEIIHEKKWNKVRCR